jgi:hypothetical protein
MMVYWLEEPSDLINVLAISPNAPVMAHENDTNIYVMHTPYRLVFILETEAPLGDLEIPFRGEAELNRVRVRRVRAMTHDELAGYLEGGEQL